MSKKVVISIVASLILLVVVVGLVIPRNENEEIRYDYKIIYNDGMNPGNEYTIEISSNYDMKVKRKTTCINTECDESTDEYIVDFTDNARHIVEDNLIAYFVNGNEVVLNNYELQDHTVSVIESIINKDENMLSSVENAYKEDEFLYAISSNRLNCHTVTLMLYSDNTYRYYYTFGNGDGIPKYTEGYYNYDVNELINSFSKYEDDGNGSYFITNYSEDYTTYGNNEELKNLLSSINIDLDVCLKD